MRTATSTWTCFASTSNVRRCKPKPHKPPSHEGEGATPLPLTPSQKYFYSSSHPAPTRTIAELDGHNSDQVLILPASLLCPVGRFLPSAANSALRLACARLLWPLLTSPGVSLGLSTSIAAIGPLGDLPGYDAPAFTLMPAATTCASSVQTLDFGIMGPLIRCIRLGGSCSSGQRFAMDFLPTSPRGSAVVLRLDLPSARRSSD